MGSTSRYGELTAKVDAFFTRVAARHGDDMQCGSGCHDCCADGLTVTRVEADAIRHEVASWEASRRAELRVRAKPTGCAALDAAGRCRIYAARPIVCRSHGAPVRLREGRSLPVVSACEKNFRRGEPAADCVLDQETLSALVLAVDRDHRRDAGGDGTRTAIADLLAELFDAPAR